MPVCVSEQTTLVLQDYIVLNHAFTLITLAFGQLFGSQPTATAKTFNKPQTGDPLSEHWQAGGHVV